MFHQQNSQVFLLSLSDVQKIVFHGTAPNKTLEKAFNFVELKLTSDTITLFTLSVELLNVGCFTNRTQNYCCKNTIKSFKWDNYLLDTY